MLLEIQDLDVRFPGDRGTLQAVHDLSFQVAAGETVAIVGESGSGKSVTAMSILRLLDETAAETSGRILFKGRDLLRADEAEMRQVRGGEIGMVFQEPMTSLNPVMKVGRQIAEAARLHQRLSRGDAKKRVIEMLGLVGISEPERRMRNYPHQFSGGMRQRAMIAMALACNPALLIADEPTTALDVTVQAQILELMRDLKGRFGSAIILITHDLGVVAEMADRVIIMYAGRKLEEGSTREIFRNPQHPYTRGLLGAGAPVASTSPQTSPGRRMRLVEIPGLVPDLRQPIEGCAFEPRCPIATALCVKVAPVLEHVGSGQSAACHYAEHRSAA